MSQVAESIERGKKRPAVVHRLLFDEFRDIRKPWTPLLSFYLIPPIRDVL